MVSKTTDEGALPSAGANKKESRCNMRVFFISDPHFGHKNILKFERTEFQTIEEHDAFIVEQINKTVKLTDLLYILGDVGNSDKIRLLNGRKILIMGNHDARSKREYETYFSEVYETPVYYNKRVLLSHHPVPVTSDILNIHGHLHGSYLASNNHLNVSAAMVRYRPVGLDVLGNKVAALPKNNTNFLEEWYADLYTFTNHEKRTDIVTDNNGRVLVKESLKLRETIKTDSKGFALNVFEE